MNQETTNNKPDPEGDAPKADETEATADTGAQEGEEGLPKGEPTLEDALEEAQAEAATLKDRLLRAMADAENLRRRTEREREDTAKYAITNFARDLLSVADNLGRALDTLPENVRADETFANFIEGVELTGRELVIAFEKHGIKEVRPQGEKFDHNLHQAIFEVEDPEQNPGTITQVMQIGYTLGDRLLRAAMVGVSKSPAAPAAVEEPPVDDEAKD